MGEAPEPELDAVGLVRRRKLTLLRATGRKWICKRIELRGLTVYAASSTSSSASAMWGMPARQWLFTPLPPPPQSWTCDVCHRKKTPVTESLCRVCGTARLASNKLKYQRQLLQQQQLTPHHTPPAISRVKCVRARSHFLPPERLLKRTALNGIEFGAEWHWVALNEMNDGMGVGGIAPSVEQQCCALHRE